MPRKEQTNNMNMKILDQDFKPKRSSGKIMQEAGFKTRAVKLMMADKREMLRIKFRQNNKLR